MNLGRLFVDIDGAELSPFDEDILRHPHIGGVILFSRNFKSIEQLHQLITVLRKLRTPPLLIAVDHEGGRVQRFREGFTHLPPAEWLGEIYDQAPEQASTLAYYFGWIIAAELRCLDIDLSFSPVLDLNHGLSAVIGDRSLHRCAQAVIALADSMVRGMSNAGMSAVGKHFPGHGGVSGDTHHANVIDRRTYSELVAHDLSVYTDQLLDTMGGIMCAHVRYPAIDQQPAGFSSVWLQGILREQLGFKGIIFSDDLTMIGAQTELDPLERVMLAFSSGCDVALLCNDRQAVETVLDRLNIPPRSDVQQRLASLRGRGDFGQTLAELQRSDEHVSAIKALRTFSLIDREHRL